MYNTITYSSEIIVNHNNNFLSCILNIKEQVNRDIKNIKKINYC